MGTPTISIIVPVYNVEAYLPKCIDSILAQTFRDFELILVDDGSPDNCPALCDAAAERDERIRVIHQKNGGLSAARNAGLDIARGEWIGFVDSDDYIASEMYETLYHAVQEYGAELAVCEYLFVDEQGNPKMPLTQDPKTFVYSREQAIGKIASTAFHIAPTKLYQRSIFSELRFPVGRLNEDSFVAPAVLEQTSKVVYLQNQFYYYFQRTGSIMYKQKTLRNYDAVEAAYCCWQCQLRYGPKEGLPKGALFVLGSLRQVYCGLSKEDQRSARSREMMKLQRNVAWETLRKGKFSVQLLAQTVFFQLWPMGYDHFAVSKRVKAKA